MLKNFTISMTFRILYPGSCFTRRLHRVLPGARTKYPGNAQTQTRIAQIKIRVSAYPVPVAQIQTR